MGRHDKQLYKYASETCSPIRGGLKSLVQQHVGRECRGSPASCLAVLEASDSRPSSACAAAFTSCSCSISYSRAQLSMRRLHEHHVRCMHMRLPSQGITHCTPARPSNCEACQAAASLHTHASSSSQSSPDLLISLGMYQVKRLVAKTGKALHCLVSQG